MQWTAKYFEYKSRWWKDTISSPGKGLTPGQVAYAERQSALWLGMMTFADKSFRDVNSAYIKFKYIHFYLHLQPSLSHQHRWRRYQQSIATILLDSHMGKPVFGTTSYKRL